MQEPVIFSAAEPAHGLWWVLGLVALALNKARYTLGSYRRPRPFRPGDAEAAAEYDTRVWANWLVYLRDYRAGPYDLAGKCILELGPGPDLGLAALALAAGAGRYVAFDRFPLARSRPWATHERVLERVLARAGVGAGEAGRVTGIVQDALVGRVGPLTYHYREDFDLTRAGLPPADLIVSQAALEHFDDPQATIAQLSPLAAPGAVFLAVVDLQTHTPLLRRRDPLNIYRYPPRLYRLLSFPGAPNRVRPHDYDRWLGEGGWTDIQVRPLLVLQDSYVQAMLPHLAEPFRSREAQMEWLTVLLCATRP